MKVLAIAGTNLKRMLRDRSNIFFVFIFRKRRNTDRCYVCRLVKRRFGDLSLNSRSFGLTV